MLLSTLTPPSRDGSTPGAITALLLNPSNPLQLIIATQDGLISIWDYTEAKLLKTLDLVQEIAFIVGHPSLGDQLFVALVGEETKDAGIYLISLKPAALAPNTTASPSIPRTPSRRMRLAKPRPLVALAISPSGKHLISINPHQINILHTDQLEKGFGEHIASDPRLTCLAFHPSENWFSTGDALGRIRLWYNVLSDEKVEKNAVVESTTSLLHWHAHAVASICFTPNGAYLLSGGQEAVMVLWQLHSGHQEYVPRLGAPIQRISVSGNGDGEKEMEIAARLQDGSTVFVGAQKLKIARVIAGMKMGQSFLPEFLKAID